MRRSSALLIVLLLMASGLSGQQAAGELNPYVSHPGNIPNLQNFSTPQLEPGESGKFQLKLTNRYLADMKNVSLKVKIYMRADIDSAEEIDKVSLPPTIKEAVSGTTGIGSRQEWAWEYAAIEPKGAVFPAFNISTTEKTDEGTYFVSFALYFDFNNTHRVMLSRGHWNATEWEAATSDVTKGSPGNINLTKLKVDGIIPDSSFGVKKPIPRWPLYVLIGLTVLFGGLAVVFYLEEEGTYPQLNKWLQQQRGKFQQLRLLFENRRRQT